MIAERQKLFDERPEEPDLSRFAPRTDTPSAPSIEAVRSVSTAAGFPNRDPMRELRPGPRMAPISERHYYRTGRDTQFNTKVRADTKAAYIAIATEDGVPLGKVIEDALDALMRERQSRRAGEDTPPK
jgi:hypothetical protein